MATVEMYTKMGCSYCTHATRLLNAKGVEFTEIDVTMGGACRKEMLERAPHHTTTPSIFIDGRHIGGYDDLAALDRDGKLDALIGQTASA